MNKKTQYRKTVNVKLTIFFGVIALLIVFLFVQLIITTWTNHEVDMTTKIITSLIPGGILLSLVTSVTGSILGSLKGKRVINKEDKYIKQMNPYIYYRELPNNYGIGVTSLLFDSTIENYKDIVAVILDLCAKKYLSLAKQEDKYIIKVLKGIDDNLLDNEKYIISLLLNNDIKNIDYDKWYNYCMQDGINLGLYYNSDNKVDSQKNTSKHSLNKLHKLHILLSIIVTSFILYNWYTKEEELILIMYIVSGLILYLGSYIILTVPINALILAINAKERFKQSLDMSYIQKLNNQLTRTQKGIEELQKLLSFKAFIKDFGHFIDKKPEEVVLWDRYLSYAQVFGLTKEIMTSGYKELIDNSSFHIDNIDDINLSNIEVN